MSEIGAAPESVGDAIAARFGERDRRALLDLIAFADLAADLVSRGRAAYDGEVQFRLAGEALHHRFGEAVARLSSALVDAHPDIRFGAMKRARNLVAHNYDIVSPAIIWNTLAVEYPKDVAKIRALLAG